MSMHLIIEIKNTVMCCLMTCTYSEQYVTKQFHDSVISESLSTDLDDIEQLLSTDSYCNQVVW
jgi:hypothetical protein